jgi:hypothetical protein
MATRPKIACFLTATAQYEVPQGLRVSLTTNYAKLLNRPVLPEFLPNRDSNRHLKICTGAALLRPMSARSHPDAANSTATHDADSHRGLNTWAQRRGSTPRLNSADQKKPVILRRPKGPEGSQRNPRHPRHPFRPPAATEQRYALTAVQNLHLFACFGISLKHSGQALVVGSGVFLTLAIR